MAAPTILEKIIATTREDVERRRREAESAPAPPPPEAPPEPRPGQAPGAAPFTAALTARGISVIAEHKRRSPSAGVLREGAPVAEIVGAYERGGARALSILTEERHFGGSLGDLREARALSSLPILRKDFIVDEFQLGEAAGAGADAVLLIVAALEEGRLGALHRAAGELGLETLVEVHTAAELDAALALEGAVLGINNRDLHDFSVDMGRTLALLPGIPSGRVVVSESGITERAQLDELEAAGVAAVLVGETVMTARDPEQATRALSGAPRLS